MPETERPRPPLSIFEFSAAVGGGHTQASEALVTALRASREVTLSQGDYVSYVSGFWRFVSLDLYRYWLQHAPGGYRNFYNFTDRGRGSGVVTDAFHWVGLTSLLRDLRPVGGIDLMLSSFPTNVALADNARRMMRRHFLNALVVTDYRVHRHWVRPEADLLLVPSEEARLQVLERGFDERRVVASGIPVGTRVRELSAAGVPERRALREQHGLRDDRPLLLVSSGAQGTYRALPRLLSALGGLGRAVQVVVTGGGMQPGREQLGGADVRTLGFTRDFPELLAAADLVVGKAGGLTVAESLALGVPLVVFEPIPGQEEHNAEYLERHGAGVWAREETGLRRAVLLALDPERAAPMSMAARRLGVPDAAERGAAALLRALDTGLAR